VFKLRFSESQVSKWAARYVNTTNDSKLRENVRPKVLSQGHLDKDQFLKICYWKTPRTKSRCASNDEFSIRTISRAAFANHNESLKMDLLRTLVGVEWPTASTLLHFCDRQPYPILDYRALWSLGYDKVPRYTMEFWLEYLTFTRTLARRLKVDIGSLDRALWQYSKAHQPSGRHAA
jgi:hypothetical protein